MRASRTLISRAGAVAVMSAFALAVPGPPSGQVDRERAVASLVEAERAFSKASEDRGTREAFLTFLSRDAVVFRPSPVAGRPVYEKMAAGDPSVLTWAPEIAEVASSGELGYTSGPYSVRPKRDAAPASFGHYVSVWQREPDGAWKVLLDIGVRHDRPRPGRSAGPGRLSRRRSPAAPLARSAPGRGARLRAQGGRVRERPRRQGRPESPGRIRDGGRQGLPVPAAFRPSG